MATVVFGRRTALWDVANPRRPARIATLPNTDGNTLWGQAFSPDHRVLATAYNGGIVLWDVTSPARPRLLRSLDAPATSPPRTGVGSGSQDLAFSPDGSILASATGTDRVTLWDVNDPAHAHRMATLGGADGFIVAFAFSPGGNMLAAVTYQGTTSRTASPS